MKTLEIKLEENKKPKVVKIKQSGGIGTLNMHDLIKGLAIAGISGAWVVIYQSVSVWINGDPFTIVLEDVARAGVSGIIGYLSYNFFQKPKVVINAKELK